VIARIDLLRAAHQLVGGEGLKNVPAGIKPTAQKQPCFRSCRGILTTTT